MCWINTGQELAGKVEVETVAGPKSQRQEVMERGRSGDGRSTNNRGCVSDLLPDMLKPAFPAKSDLPPTSFFVNFFVAKNKDRLPKITFGVFFSFFFICCQKLDLLPKA